MKWIKTIRARFALWLTALILAFLVAFGGFVYVSLSISLRAAVDDTLALSAEQTAANLNVENGYIQLSEEITPDESDSEAFTARGLTSIVLAQDGSIIQSAGIYRSQPAPIANTASQGTFFTLPESSETDHIRVYILPILDNHQVVGWVQTMKSLSEVEDSLHRLVIALLLGGGGLTLLASFAGYFLAASTLAPIDKITRTARHITTSDLTLRLNLPDTGDEIGRLATTFNEMLERLETGFKRERQFTADASHELRTPLAAMQAILAVTREKERTPPEYQQALTDLSDETDRMRSLVEDLLRLARGEKGFSLQLAALDLSLLLSDVVDVLQPLAASKGLALNHNLPPTLPFTGDMDALIRLFVNLVDNAIKYTEKGSISVSARQDENTILVQVSDTGIGIPPEHLPHIFERFYRVESARSSGGAGLGLAIARQIAQAHGGKITVSSQVSKGTHFIVALPQIGSKTPTA